MTRNKTLGNVNTDSCPLCGRELGTRWNLHHLVPRAHKGSETVALHEICHNTIHATFTERELTNHFHTIERLLEDERIRRFVSWVRKKPIDFYQKTKDTNTRRKKRRR